jgi:hypothetical protein
MLLLTFAAGDLCHDLQLAVARLRGGRCRVLVSHLPKFLIAAQQLH